MSSNIRFSKSASATDCHIFGFPPLYDNIDCVTDMETIALNSKFQKLIELTEELQIRHEKLDQIKQNSTDNSNHGYHSKKIKYQSNRAYHHQSNDEKEEQENSNEELTVQNKVENVNDTIISDTQPKRSLRPQTNLLKKIRNSTFLTEPQITDSNNTTKNHSSKHHHHQVNQSSHTINEKKSSNDNETIDNSRNFQFQPLHRKTPTELFMNDLRMLINTVEKEKTERTFFDLKNSLMKSLFHPEKSKDFDNESHTYILDSFSDILLMAISQIHNTDAYVDLIQRMMFYNEEPIINTKLNEKNTNEMKTSLKQFFTILNNQVKTKLQQKFQDFLLQNEMHEKKLFLAYCLFYVKLSNIDFFHFDEVMIITNEMQNVVLNETITVTDTKHRASDFVCTLLCKTIFLEKFLSFIDKKVKCIWETKQMKGIDMVTKVKYFDVKDTLNNYYKHE